MKQEENRRASGFEVRSPGGEGKGKIHQTFSSGQQQQQKIWLEVHLVGGKNTRNPYPTPRERAML